MGFNREKRQATPPPWGWPAAAKEKAHGIGEIVYDKSCHTTHHTKDRRHEQEKVYHKARSGAAPDGLAARDAGHGMDRPQHQARSPRGTSGAPWKAAWRSAGVRGLRHRGRHKARVHPFRKVGAHGGGHRPFPDTPKILASRSALPPKSRKIIKNKSQGATPGHRTLQSPNFARCDTATSHPATLSHRTLRHLAITPCHFRLSHPATRKPRLGHDFSQPIRWNSMFASACHNRLNISAAHARPSCSLTFAP